MVNGAFPFNAAKNAEQFSSRTYSQLADQAWTATNASTAKTVYSQISDMLLREQFVSDLVVSAHTYAISTKLQGLAWNMFDYLDLDNASLSA